MNICIVTVYDSINSGSYWQAKCLEMVLGKWGHKVFFLKRVGDNSGSSASRMSKMKKYLTLLIKRGVKCASLYRKRLKEYKKLVDEFSVIDINDVDSMDCFVLGSDTIWNLNSKYFLAHRNEYWGYSFLSKNIITYAGSVANTKADKIKEYPELTDCVQHWSSISVRDYQTKEMISTVTDKDIVEVCDPTLLIPPDWYPESDGPSEENDFIFLYLFNELDSVQAEELVSFARENHLKIIQGAGDREYSHVDSMSINAPMQFVANMRRAQYVITDTFHGTLFSTIFEKQFVVLDRGKEKIADYLIRTHLSDRLVKTDGALADILTESIDYSYVESSIEEMRTKGLEFLKSSLEEL